MRFNSLDSSTTLVYVVNDDPTQVTYLLWLLKEQGFKTRGFHGAEEALKVLSTQEVPDLIVTDLNMPGMDGWRFCRALRSHPCNHLNHIPILVVSATFAGEVNQRLATDMGANGFMSSPVDGKRFIQVIMSLISGDGLLSLSRVLLAGRSQELFYQIGNELESRGYHVELVSSERDCIDKYNSTLFDIAILDQNLSLDFGMLVHNLHNTRNETAIIVTTDDPSPELAVEWINQGASAYALKPFDPLYILDLCSRVRREKALFRMEELLEKRTRALKESEHRYRSLFQNNHSVMLIIDPVSGQIAEANQAAVRYYGWSVEAITSMKISDLNILSKEEVFAEMEKARKESRSQFYFKHCLAGGEIRDVEVFSGPIVIEGKTMLYSIIHDITRRKQVEQELIQSNMDLKMAEEVAGMGSWKYHPEKDVFTGSDGFFRIMGRRENQQICFKEFLKLVHMENQSEVSRVWENILDSYESFDFDFRIVVNQKIKCLRMVGAAQTRLDGRRVSAMGMIMDISEKKALEIKKKQQQEHLAQASKMAALGTLVAGVAHEINNPNNLIMLNTPILENVWKDSLPVLETHQCTDPEFKIAGLPFNVMKDYTARLFSGVKEGSTRISKIVSELKDFARQSPLDMSKYVDINEVAESALTLVQKTMSRFTDNFSLTLEPELPLILGDFQKLEQIVVNLLINAGQALNNKSQAVSLKTFHDIEQKSVGFRITDHGVGIPPENMKRIFDPFFSTKRETGGTGLGLAISSSIIQDHHGKMHLESTPDKGTEVTVMLKLPHADK